MNRPARGNFLADYLHATGTSEVPKVFHRWCALSVLSAVMMDRVWVRKGASILRPNLYIFLIGPSGCGKGEAIATGLRLLKDVPQVAMEYGRTTAAALVDRLAARASSLRDASKVFLVTPELTMAVGRGTQSDDLIKLMTELYTGSDVPLVERTRTSGRHIVRGHCLNWLAGTTKDWLRDCVTREAVEGGFFARVACVQANYGKTRHATPTLPADYEATVRRLQAHIECLLSVEAEVTFHPVAQELHDQWYHGRPEPEDEILMPSWRREDDAVRKLAVLLAMAEPDPQPMVLPKHATEAQQLVAGLARQLPAIIDFIGAGVDSDLMRRVRRVIQEAKVIQHPVLAQNLARVGVTSDRLRLCVDTLIEAGIVRRDRSPERGGWTYTWVRRRLQPGGDHAV